MENIWLYFSPPISYLDRFDKLIRQANWSPIPFFCSLCIKVSRRRRKTVLVPQTNFLRLWHGRKNPWRYALKCFKTIQPRTFRILPCWQRLAFIATTRNSIFFRTIQSTGNSGDATHSRLRSTAWGKVLLLVGCRLTDKKRNTIPWFAVHFYLHILPHERSRLRKLQRLLSCSVAPPWRTPDARSMEQAILFFHRYFSDGSAILCATSFLPELSQVEGAIPKEWKSKR